MLSTGNKMQIIDIISKYLIEKLENPNYEHFQKIYIPVQAENGVAFKRTDLKSVHEKLTFINIIKQCMACVKLEVNCVKVICDDTDVFVLLTVYVIQQGRKLKKLVEAFWH